MSWRNIFFAMRPFYANCCCTKLCKLLLYQITCLIHFFKNLKAFFVKNSRNGSNRICVFCIQGFFLYSVWDDDYGDDKYDLCISVASGSDVISRSGRLFAGLVKATAASSNKFPIKICLQFILTCTQRHCLDIAN